MNITKNSRPDRGIFSSRYKNLLPVLALALIAVFTLSGCDLGRNYLKPDRSANLEMQDYRDALAPRTPEVADSKTAAEASAAIPSLQPYITAPSDNLKPMPLVSISVNQSVPLRDILYELAQQADYDLELDPRIRGSIIFTAKDRPFDVVIERIASISGLRYEFKEDTLRVELDTAYNKLYKIDYLSYVRTNAGSINNTTAVGSGEGADTGSEFTATTQSEANFWGELETNLTQLLGSRQATLTTRNDPQVTVTDPNPNVEPVTPNPDGSIPEQPEAVLNVQAIPDAAAEEPAEEGEGTGATFSLNRQAGIVNVYATARQQKEVQEYLDLLRRAVTAQVLIEAKILEVTLNDEFVAGIDWRILNLAGGKGVLNFLSPDAATATTGSLDQVALGAGGNYSPLLGGTVASDNAFVLGYAGTDIQALVKAISGFGTVHALASPRLTVLNNQSAVLNVANNRVFFEIDVDTSTEEGVTTTEISSEIRNVPEGVLVNVQPSIDLTNKTVSLALRPTITRVIRTVSDPGIQYVTAEAGIEGVESLIPELNVQEIDSVIQVRSGQPVVMGGLLQDRTANDQSAVPVLGEIPMVGALFRDTQDLVQKTELVIFLKATILESPSDTVHDADKDLYRMFSGDRRPLKL